MRRSATQNLIRPNFLLIAIVANEGKIQVFLVYTKAFLKGTEEFLHANIEWFSVSNSEDNLVGFRQ